MRLRGWQIFVAVVAVAGCTAGNQAVAASALPRASFTRSPLTAARQPGRHRSAPVDTVFPG